MSTIKVKTQTRFMVLFTSRSSLMWGNLQVLCLASPQVFTHYLPLTIDFSHLYRDCTMTEYAFFAGKAERWGEGHDASMGKSQHLPPPELPRTPASFLWGTTFHQQPKNLGGCPGTHSNIAYLLVCTGDALEAQN